MPMFLFHKELRGQERGIVHMLDTTLYVATVLWERPTSKHPKISPMMWMIKTISLWIQGGEVMNWMHSLCGNAFPKVMEDFRCQSEKKKCGVITKLKAEFLVPEDQQFDS